MDGKSGKDYLKDYINKKQPILEKYIGSKHMEAAKIGKLNEDILKRFLEMAKEGKGIRGALVKLGYEICGGLETANILDTSIFIELFHSAVLIHDDIMDEDETRRKLPTMHKQYEQVCKELNLKTQASHYGESMAINVGDIGFFMAFEVLLQSDFPLDLMIKAGKIYTAAVIRTAYGQAMDVTNEVSQNPMEEDILNVQHYKTAEYTGVMPLIVGATLAGEKNEKTLNAMKEYGLCFGWAFQIQDDTIGLFGDEEKIGKPVGSDIREGKNTLFTLHLSKHGTSEQKEFLKYALGNKNITKMDVEKMKHTLKDAGSYQHVIDLGWKYVTEGKKYIPQITQNKQQQKLLESLLIYMMERVS